MIHSDELGHIAWDDLGGMTKSKKHQVMPGVPGATWALLEREEANRLGIHTLNREEPVNALSYLPARNSGTAGGYRTPLWKRNPFKKQR